LLIPATFCVYLILAFGLDLNGKMASVVGRDPTLTDRTLIWHVVLSEHTNPVFGTGYESFWLGSRLDRIWAQVGPVNEAHNGYLEAYLNLGGIGLILLLAFLLASYGTIFSTFKTSAPLARFNLVVWATVLFYNVTEAAFRSGLMWLMLLLGGLFIPARSQDHSHVLNPIAERRRQKRQAPRTDHLRSVPQGKEILQRGKRIKSGIGPADILRENT
ncbi:MAG TPA: O-antigen ligase family protein, partial [Desulfomonilaceae bacterium]|nr:O-antigen ligase family protein [Desulfomonilaceae bacterium]